MVTKVKENKKMKLFMELLIIYNMNTEIKIRKIKL